MAGSKRRGFSLKRRISCVIPSFNLCRSKNEQSGQPAPARPSRNVYSSACGCSGTELDDDFAWGQDDTWHVVAKLRRRDDESLPRRKIYISTPQIIKMEHGRKKKKKRRSRGNASTLFEETEQLLMTSNETASSAVATTVMKRGHIDSRERQRERCLALAVVKRSEDPISDFKRSMFEMILENEIFHESELQQLLRCFLSLNSKQHYPTILRAFSHVWVTLFCTAE